MWFNREREAEDVTEETTDVVIIRDENGVHELQPEEVDADGDC